MQSAPSLNDFKKSVKCNLIVLFFVVPSRPWYPRQKNLLLISKPVSTLRWYVIKMEVNIRDTQNIGISVLVQDMVVQPRIMGGLGGNTDG